MNPWKYVPLFLVVPALFLACGDAPESLNPVKSPPADPSHLDVPPAGTGFQFQTQDMQVAPGNEEQDCYFFKVSDLAKQGGLDATKPINLHRVQVGQRPGSHHMNIFRVKTIVGLDPANGAIQKGTNGMGQCFVSPNWADWPLVANSQANGEVDWTFPDGVANVIHPDEWLMLQTHYVNATTQKTTDYGHVSVNFWTIADSDVKQELGTLFATKQSIRICQHNPTPTFEGGCQISAKEPVTIIGANAHFHSRGKTFDMFSWDGKSVTTPPVADRFYESTAWDEPPMLHSPDLNLSIPSPGGVWYKATYEWTPPDPSVGCQGLNDYDQTKCEAKCAMQADPAACKTACTTNLDCCYTFGGIVEKNEHCNIFVYYYPKQDNIVCE